MLVSLTLRDFIPTGFCGISEIVYTPKSLLQIIIGTNGAGKSSLLRACSLALLDKKEFGSNGFREQQLKVDQTEYTLRSDFSSKTPKHEFWKDGKNLNQGGTSTVQKELIETNFGYTPFHHKLLTGSLSFTDMSPNIRKDMLIMISGLELDYAMDLFERVRSTQRDVVGASRHVVQKYSDAAKRLASMDFSLEIEQEAEQIVRELNELTPMTNFTANSMAIKNKINGVSGRIENLYKEHRRIFKSIKKLTAIGRFKTDESEIGSFDEINRRVNISQQKTMDHDEKIGDLIKELGELESQLGRFENVPDDINRDVFEEEIAELQLKIEAFGEMTIVERPDMQRYQQQLLAVHERLHLIKEMKSPSYRSFSVEERNQINDDYREMGATLARFKSKLEETEKRLSHAKIAQEGNTTCPKCEYVTLANGALSEERLKEMEKTIVSLRERISVQEKEFQLLGDQMDKLKEFDKVTNSVQEMARSFPAALDFIKSIGNPVSIPEKIETAISLTYSEYTAVLRYMECEQLKKELDEKKMLLSLMNVSGKKRLMSRQKEAEEKLTEMYTEKKLIEKHAAYYTAVKSAFTALNALDNELNTVCVPELNALYVEFAKSLCDELVNEEVRQKQTRLANLTKIISDYKMFNERLSELKSEEEELAQRKASLELLMTCISPKKGLIAEQLHGVIAAVVNEINEIVSSVWEKELNLVVPEFGKSLDFLFKTFIEGIDGPDIKDLSAGQKEIVNFAMTLIIMRQLKLTDYPLLLDETSANMDSLHRGNFMRYIKDLVDVGEFKSIFLVSHYASEYGGFTNADVIVLNPDNIGLPQGNYNDCIMLA